MSAERVEVVLRVKFPYGEIGRTTGAPDRPSRDRDGAVAGEAKLGWAYADNGANDDQPRDREVDRAVARSSPLAPARRRWG